MNPAFFIPRTHFRSVKPIQNPSKSYICGIFQIMEEFLNYVILPLFWKNSEPFPSIIV